MELLKLPSPDQVQFRDQSIVAEKLMNQRDGLVTRSADFNAAATTAKLKVVVGGVLTFLAGWLFGVS